MSETEPFFGIIPSVMSRLCLVNLGWVLVGWLSLAWIGAAGVVGCAAGYKQGVERRSDPVERRAAVLKEVESSYESKAGRAFEAQLLLTRAGAVISRAIRAHGGWDAWFALGKVTYLRETIGVDYSEKHAVKVEEPPVRFNFSIDPDGIPHIGSRPEVAEEYFRFSLPFCLVDPGWQREYYGVETDSKTGQLFERVRHSRDTPDGVEWFIVWFNYSGATVSRLLQKTPDGGLLLIQFSGRQDHAGVLIPSKRSYCGVTSVFQRCDFGRPDQIDLLVEIESGS